MFLLKNPPNEFVAHRGAGDCQKRLSANLIFEIDERGVDALVVGRISTTTMSSGASSRATSSRSTSTINARWAMCLPLWRLERTRRADDSLGANPQSASLPVQTRKWRNPSQSPTRRAVNVASSFRTRCSACNTRRRMLLRLEIDMGAEQHEDSDLKSVTLRQKFRAYRVVMREKIFASQFGLPSLVLLTVTPGVVRMRNMMDHLTPAFDGDAGGLEFVVPVQSSAGARAAITREPPDERSHADNPVESLRHPQLNLARLVENHVLPRSSVMGGMLSWACRKTIAPQEAFAAVRHACVLCSRSSRSSSMGKVVQGVICLFLQCTIIGWLPAAMWAGGATRELLRRSSVRPPRDFI